MSNEEIIGAYPKKIKWFLKSPRKKLTKCHAEP
jgi:hypothetical protein